VDAASELVHMGSSSGHLYRVKRAEHHQEEKHLWKRQDTNAAMSDASSKIQIPQILSAHSQEHKQRRRRQMMFFYGATAVTLLSARLAYRGVQARKCM
jgi:hypothetical protein